MHFGKPRHWLKIDGIWYEKKNSGFIQPVYADSSELNDTEKAAINALTTCEENTQVSNYDIVKFRKGVCKRVLEDYEADRPPDEEEIVESFVAVANCPEMVDDYRFLTYGTDTRDECECLALFDIFSSLRDPAQYLKGMAYGQRIVATVNVIPKDIWTQLHNWKRRDNILEYWIHYKKGRYQTYFNEVGFSKFLQDNGFQLLLMLDDEENGMGTSDAKVPEDVPDAKRAYTKRINARTFAAVKVVDDE
jgi:hypothetical protein